MSSNVGLSTPRGSGTSGYVQRNLSHVKPRDSVKPYSKDVEQIRHRQRQPDKDILEHDRKREVEVKVFELRDRLEDEGADEGEIDEQCEALRKKLQSEQESNGARGPDKRTLKSHQVHELAKAKIEETERLRNALGISKDYEEGSHWRKQEERRAKVERAPERESSDESERRDS
ncbi:cwf21-domain-containing protein [Polychaeton citri CBS 116435]|uniref:Cwf21-domain-containing protein n=1 Tax=Polychaeton citri CBS 116435 TaxID=1314669 RepID=A0A9P4Q473_9PEZI|nr:cwf21-domain-containing protein [Polychaeton citri CBS 116435]